MPYDRTNDIAAGLPDGASFGAYGRVVTPSDDDDLAFYAKSLTVISVAEGDTLSIIPARNADANPINYVGVTVGMIVPYRVRRVRATGTAATVATIDV